MGILQMFKRRGKPELLGKYLSPDVVEKLLRETKPEIKSPEAKHFQFILILLDDTKPQDALAIISGVLGTLTKHRATITNNTPSLLVGLLGVPFSEGNSQEARRNLVHALLKEHGDQIRIAHGECDGVFGMFGGNERWIYGAVIPGFSAILKQLLETKFGTAVETS
jgi:hypothetical protein